MTTYTKTDVKKALAELYVGGSKHDGYRYVRSILPRHGAGATTIHNHRRRVRPITDAERRQLASLAKADPTFDKRRLLGVEAAS